MVVFGRFAVHMQTCILLSLFRVDSTGAGMDPVMFGP